MMVWKNMGQKKFEIVVQRRLVEVVGRTNIEPVSMSKGRHRIGSQVLKVGDLGTKNDQELEYGANCWYATVEGKARFEEEKCYGMVPWMNAVKYGEAFCYEYYVHYSEYPGPAIE